MGGWGGCGKVWGEGPEQSQSRPRTVPEQSQSSARAVPGQSQGRARAPEQGQSTDQCKST